MRDEAEPRGAKLAAVLRHLLWGPDMGDIPNLSKFWGTSVFLDQIFGGMYVMLAESHIRIDEQ